MKLVGLKRKSRDSDYIEFTVEGGDQSNSIGDQVWFSPCGTVMEIASYCDDDVAQEVLDMFDNKLEAYREFDYHGII